MGISTANLSANQIFRRLDGKSAVNSPKTASVTNILLVGGI